MPDASFIQTNFLGGEWSLSFQGRMDDPRYKSGMNVCRNGIPIEEGSWSRRSGSRWAAPTRFGQDGVLRRFAFKQSQPFTMEFTDLHLRFFSGPALVKELKNYVTSITSANPVVFGTANTHGFSVGDEVQFDFASGTTNTGVATIVNRQFKVATVPTGSTFTAVDSVDGSAIDGTTLTLGAGNLMVSRVVTLTTILPLADLNAMRVVQNENVLLVLSATHKTYSLISTPSPVAGEPATFTYAPAVFLDGPYLDPPTDGSTITPSATTGTITLTASSVASINGGLGFQSTDVGRPVRLFSEAADWAIGTAYAIGDTVKFANDYYIALLANTAKQPDTDINNWVVDPTAAAWTWGNIQTVTDTTHVTITLASVDPTGNFAGGPLKNTAPVKTWRLGKYSDTTGWPAVGCYHENRFYISGGDNQFDAGVTNGDANGTINFCPTGPDGTVADNNGISEKIKSDDSNPIFWMMPDHQGVILGTQGGEWLLQASSLNDPITVTSIQAHRVTKYGCIAVPPQKTGLSTVFVHRYARKLIEYVGDPYTGKFSGTNLSIPSKHLTATSIAEIAYVEETVPIVWARTTKNALIGMTYKRESPFTSQPANFSGWHRHDLGSGRVVTSIQGGPSTTGAIDTLAMITNDTTTNIRWVEFLSNVFEEGDALANGFFLDDATTPVAALFIAGTPNTIKLWGMHYLAGKTVSVTFAGLDLGDFLVAADGTIILTLDVAGSSFTTAYFQSFPVQTTNTFNDLGIIIIGTSTAGTPILGGIQDFVNSVSPLTGLNTSAFVTNWDDGVGYAISGGNNNAAGFRRFNMNTGVETGYNQAGAAGLNIGPLGFVIDPITLSAKGDLYWNDNNGDPGTLRKVAGASLAATGSVAGHPVPYSMVTSEAVDTYVWGSNLSGTCSVYAYNGRSMTYSGFSFNLGETRGVLCPGPTFKLGGFQGSSIYCMGKHKPDEPSILPLGLYRFSVDTRSNNWNYIVQGNNPNITGLKIGVMNPHDIDATWTHFTNLRGPLYDATDGNVIFWAEITTPSAYGGGNSYFINDVVLGSNNHVYASLNSGNIGNDPTTDGGVHWADRGVATYTNLRYIVKWSTKDATVVWKTALNAVPNADRPLNQTRIQFGRLGWLSPATTGSNNYPYYFINTLTGAIISTTSVNQVVASASIFDDLSARTVIFGQYTSGGSAPLGLNGTVSFTAQWADFVGTPGGITNYYGPFVVGYTYTSQGQILRPIIPNEAGAANGPALAKTRREHMFGALLRNTKGISFGTDFTNLNTALLMSPGGTVPLTDYQMFSGIHWGPLNDDYGFDSMLCWQITRPLPAAVLTVGNFLHTQDR